MWLALELVWNFAHGLVQTIQEPHNKNTKPCEDNARASLQHEPRTDDAIASPQPDHRAVIYCTSLVQTMQEHQITQALHRQHESFTMTRSHNSDLLHKALRIQCKSITTTQASHRKYESFTATRLHKSNPLHKALCRQWKSLANDRAVIYCTKPRTDNTRSSRALCRQCKSLAACREETHTIEHCACNARASPLKDCRTLIHFIEPFADNTKPHC